MPAIHSAPCNPPPLVAIEARTYPIGSDEGIDPDKAQASVCDQPEDLVDPTRFDGLVEPAFDF